MERLNYHHLLYFWVTAREGSVARACAELHLAQPTISGQIRLLEESLGEKLFARAGAASASPSWAGSSTATQTRSSDSVES